MQPKELVQAWFEQVWNQGNTAYIDQHLADICNFTGLAPGPITCPEDFHAFHAQMTGIFDNIRIRVDDLIEQGDTVAGVAHVSATHRATGRPVQFDSHFFGLVQSDRILEAQNGTDFLSVLIQIGAMTPEGMEAGLTGGEKIGVGSA
ncbi:MAG: ester cyclase [Pseudomonadota bacterium]